MTTPPTPTTDYISQPLKNLERLIVSHFADIEAWFRAQFLAAAPPFYCSTDLRNNGYKIAPIDTNLFPGGFNNIAAHNYPLAAAALCHEVERVCADARSVLLIAESHTRNMPYLENIATLKHLLESAGLQVTLGRLDSEPLHTTTPSGHELSIWPVERNGDSLLCGGAEHCMAILNNDLSTAIPPVLQNCQTPICPAPELGWSVRKKSSHFHHYEKVCEDFSALLKTDPWLLFADFHVCTHVNFRAREGLECLATAVEETLALIADKYKQHDISSPPYVVIKANAGTYGMGVIPLHHASDVFSLNRRQRNNMSVGKEGVAIGEVLIQEGIHTLDVVEAAPAEPVVYMVGASAISGFYRVNKARRDNDNLNSSGMSFSPLTFDSAPYNPCGDSTQDDAAARLYVYSVIARLAAAAAAQESLASH